MADVAVLPRWLRVRNALDYCQGVHPRFDRSIAAAFLEKTDIQMDSRVRELSKGMVTQLHLALIMAIDARLLVLDEPTIGLDLLYRRKFYDTLLNDYFDKERTILLTTHQVEEVENLFTDIIFINHGQVALAASVEELGERYKQLTTTTETAPRARALQAVLRARGVRPRRHAVRGPLARPSSAPTESCARPRSPTCSSPRWPGAPAHEHRICRRRGRSTGRCGAAGRPSPWGPRS